MGGEAKGGLIRKQMILMGGDAVVALGILILWIFRSGETAPGFFSGLWMAGFVPVLVFNAYLCEVYNVRPWRFKTVAGRAALSGGISLLVLVLLNKASFLPFPMITGILFFFAAQILWQSLYEAASQSPFFSKNILVIGTGP